MSLSKNKPSLHAIVAVPVVLIIVAAFALSIAAIMENMRFINATNQILTLVGTVRSIASNQKTFAATLGEDVWADLVGMGQISTETPHSNPWHGDLRLVTVANLGLRAETDMPTHECRRMALYFLGKQPADLGLLSMEAQSVNDTVWHPIYPPPPGAHGRAAELACGEAVYSRLALVFRVR